MVMGIRQQAQRLGDSFCRLRASHSSRCGRYGALSSVHSGQCGRQDTLHAKLNYRKFSWFNTHFSFAGVEQRELIGNTPLTNRIKTTPDYDDREWAFNGDTSKVSGNLKTIPDLPITTIARTPRL